MNKIVLFLATVFALTATTVAHAQLGKSTADVAKPAAIALDRIVYYEFEGQLHQAPLSTQELMLTCENVFNGRPTTNPLGNRGAFRITCEFIDGGATFREHFIFLPTRLANIRMGQPILILSQIKLHNLTLNEWPGSNDFGTEDLHLRYDDLAGKWDRTAARLGIDRLKLRPLFANADGCSVVLRSPDGFLNLRRGPGTNFGVVAKLFQGDVLYAGDDQCAELDGRTVCDGQRRQWTRILGVPRLDGRIQDAKTFTQGWVSNRYIQWFHCPE